MRRITSAWGDIATCDVWRVVVTCYVLRYVLLYCGIRFATVYKTSMSMYVHCVWNYINVVATVCLV